MSKINFVDGACWTCRHFSALYRVFSVDRSGELVKEVAYYHCTFLGGACDPDIARSCPDWSSSALWMAVGKKVDSFGNFI